MEELLRTLMNCGFLIFKDDTKFVLKKVSTPADPRESITDAVISGGIPQSDTSRITFEDYATAVKTAKAMIGKDEDEMIVRDVQKDTLWKAQMRYKHRGFGVRFEDLGELPSVPYPEAVRLASQRAQEFANMDEMVEEGWEVKVFPYKPE